VRKENKKLGDLCGFPEGRRDGVREKKCKDSYYELKLSGFLAQNTVMYNSRHDRLSILSPD
jgi:hypothetical protein